VKSFKIRIPTRQKWQTPDKIIEPNVDVWLTDGSGTKDCFHAGIFGPSCNYRKSIPMDRLSKVFSAEVITILRYTELFLTKNLMKRRIHICSDSRAALVELAKTATESSLVWECIQVLGKVSEFNKITLVWIPGHQGTPGNEEADRMAKEGNIKSHLTSLLLYPLV
jgi:hypothetical protein